MVERLRSSQLVKVVDFGVARLRDPQGDDWPYSEICQGHPQAGHAQRGEALREICGTPGYMAPEVILGAAPSCRCDVYAAGVVLYLLLTGRLPYRGPTASDILRLQLEGNPVPPSLVRDGLPAQVDPLVGRAMARKPEERFASMAEFGQALEQLAMDVAPGVLPYCVCGDSTCQPFPEGTWPGGDSTHCLECYRRRAPYWR